MNYKINRIYEDILKSYVEKEELVENLGKSIVYGGVINQLEWLDIAGGIIDERYKHRKFASGMSILLSRQAVELILDSTPDMLIIDDVSIGIFFYPQYVSRLIDLGECVVYNGEYDEDKMIYRNRSEDRNLDIIRMKNIIYKINNQRSNFNQKKYQEKNYYYICILCLLVIYILVLFIFLFSFLFSP